MMSRALASGLVLLAMTVAWSASPARAAAPSDDLPDGPGKKILLRACVACHDLDEVVKFKGYYTRAEWKDIVVTMKEYGADLTDGEVETLARYLDEVIGKRQ